MGVGDSIECFWGYRLEAQKQRNILLKYFILEHPNLLSPHGVSYLRSAGTGNDQTSPS